MIDCKTRRMQAVAHHPRTGRIGGQGGGRPPGARAWRRGGAGGRPYSAMGPAMGRIEPMKPIGRSRMDSRCHTELPPHAQAAGPAASRAHW